MILRAHDDHIVVCFNIVFTLLEMLFLRIGHTVAEIQKVQPLYTVTENTPLCVWTTWPWHILKCKSFISCHNLSCVCIPLHGFSICMKQLHLLQMRTSR